MPLKAKLSEQPCTSFVLPSQQQAAVCTHHWPPSPAHGQELHGRRIAQAQLAAFLFRERDKSSSDLCAAGSAYGSTCAQAALQKQSMSEGRAC